MKTTCFCSQDCKNPYVSGFSSQILHFLVPAGHDFQESENVIGEIRNCDRVFDSVFIGYFSDGVFTFSEIKFSMGTHNFGSHTGSILMQKHDFYGIPSYADLPFDPCPLLPPKHRRIWLPLFPNWFFYYLINPGDRLSARNRKKQWKSPKI